MTQEYTKDNIQVLGGLEHIRKLKGMYIGDDTNPFHLFVEIMDNAIDEAINDKSDLTKIWYDTKTREFKVQDFGRGIPHGMKAIKDPMNDTVIGEYEVVEVLMTVPNSGGKFNNDAFKLRGGLHGVGMTVVNALSKKVEVTTCIDGKAVTYRSENGGKRVGEIEYRDMTEDESRGTTVTILPDADMFETDRINEDDIIEKCRIANAMGYSVELCIDGEVQDIGEPLIDSLLHDMEPSESLLTSFEVYYEDEDEQSVRALIQYGSSTKDRYSAFTNLLNNYMGGTHVLELQRAICDAWDPYIKDRRINRGDVLIGLNSVLSLMISEPAFSSQTKERLTVRRPKLKGLFDGLTISIREFLIENESIREALLDRFEEYRLSRAKLMSQKELDKLLILNDDTAKTNGVRRRSVVEGIYECTSTSQEGTELMICEGESAAGPILATRDKNTQAVFPVRGKIKNVTGMSIEDIMKNKELRGIINAIGAGVRDNCDPARSRYSRMIFYTDGDLDGDHIISLGVLFFVSELYKLVEAGMIYVMLPPLYGWRSDKVKGRKYEFCNEYDEMPEHIRKSKSFTRYKGLGEMDEDEFKEACMDTSNRNLVQLELPANTENMKVFMSDSKAKGDVLRKLGKLQVARW